MCTELRIFYTKHIFLISSLNIPNNIHNATSSKPQSVSLTSACSESHPKYILVISWNWSRPWISIKFWKFNSSVESEVLIFHTLHILNGSIYQVSVFPLPVIIIWYCISTKTVDSSEKPPPFNSCVLTWQSHEHTAWLKKIGCNKLKFTAHVTHAFYD